MPYGRYYLDFVASVYRSFYAIGHVVELNHGASGTKPDRIKLPASKVPR